MSSQEESERLDRFRKLWEEREELRREYRREFTPTWGMDLGHIHIPLRFSSAGWSWFYVSLEITFLAFGIGFVFLGQSWRVLGIALVVGALFGLGSFVGQIQAVQLNNEQHRRNLMWRDALTQKYAARLAENDEQLRVLRDQSGEIAEQMRAPHTDIW
jgi:hypothetical protein